jgi:hypothetical protein
VLKPVAVTADNFIRAESDHYFAATIGLADGIGRFHHNREVMAIDHQTVIRANRDTLYSAAVFDLDAAPVTVTLPDAGDRFMSMIAIDEDHYTPGVAYGAGDHTYSREQIGTRYVLLGVRTLIDSTDPHDIEQAHDLQDAITIDQSDVGRFEVPDWEPTSQNKVRDALVTLAGTIPDAKGMFGARGEVDPVRHVIGTASGWGGNPDKDATYLTVTPECNDGTTVHTLTVRDVPVDGFWSISVYNADGYFQPNERDTYTINNLTAQREAAARSSSSSADATTRSPTACPSSRAGTTGSGSTGHARPSSTEAGCSRPPHP